MNRRLIILLLIVGCEEPTEPVDNSIRGYVKDSSGNAVSDAAILHTYYYHPIYNNELPRLMPITQFIVAIVNDSTHLQMWIETWCGDTVIVLTDSIYSQGSHLITWKANDFNGNTVVDGMYILNVKMLDEVTTQKIMLMQLYFFHLEMIDGDLGHTQYNWETQQDTFYTQNYHALTDHDGYFVIPIDCFPFGEEQIGMDEFGNPTDNWSIPYKTKLWIIHEGDSTFSTDWYDVDPDNGVELDITAPY